MEPRTCGGGQVDPVTGDAGHLPAPEGRNGDGRYHPVPSLPVVDGCFVPNGPLGPTTVDSAGHTFNFPKNSGRTYPNVVAGAPIPVIATKANIGTTLAGIDYAQPAHSLLLIHANSGLTLDLAAVRRLHPGMRLARFRCVLGNSHPTSPKTLVDAYVLTDGTSRFERHKFTTKDGPFSIDLPLADSIRFLTLATTDGGDGESNDDVLLGDATFDLATAN